MIYGVGYMVGGAVLAIRTAEAVPDAPGDAFTATLLLGSLSAIAAPALIGALTAALLLAAGSAMAACAICISSYRLRDA